MPRVTVVGNGRLAIAFDSQMNIRDFFYPRVGLENHLSGHELKVGIWADGQFSWLGDDWQIGTLEAVTGRNDVEVLATSEEGKLAIDVRDRGAGIPRSIREQIGRPFFTTKGDVGTGLGLWMVHCIVSGHRGAMRICSTAGAGTTVTLYVPVAVALAPRPSPAAVA